MKGLPVQAYPTGSLVYVLSLGVGSARIVLRDFLEIVCPELKEERERDSELKRSL